MWLVMARSHYDITRRYGDDSYLRSLGTLTEREALKILGEVLEPEALEQDAKMGLHGVNCQV